MMNLTRRFCRASPIGDFFLRTCNILETNCMSLEGRNTNISASLLSKNASVSKSVFFNFRKYYSTSNRERDVTSKKRLNKKSTFSPVEISEGFRITAFTTAEGYNLENLSSGLPRFTNFETSTFGSDFGSTTDVVHATRNPGIENSEGQDLFFFRDGCVVLWNFQDSEIQSILDFLKQYENKSFVDNLIKNEREVMNYTISDNVVQSQIHQDCVLLPAEGDKILQKYAISNAMALSVNLGAYEANLEQYIQTMEPVTEDLKAGNKIKMSRNEVLRKTGQLFALRHNINLNSDLLDTPDFYWDREELESLYQATFNYYCISKRTKVINEKINHCIELVDLLSSHLNDKHHVRLEWMIIILIMVEVAIEVCHYVDRYMESQEK